MINRFTLLLFLLVLPSTMSAQILRVQTVVSRVIAEDQTELLGAHIATIIGSRPAKISLSPIEVTLTAVSEDKQSIVINSRLSEKTPDGKITAVDFPAITANVGQSAKVRVDGYQIEFTPSYSEPPGIQVEFEGGTIARLLAGLPKNGYMVFNLIGEKNDLETVLPPISLKRVSPASLAAALNTILNPQGLSIAPSKSATMDFSGSSTVYILQRVSDPDAGKPSHVARFRSYQVGEYLDDKQTIDQITEAIRLAWEVAPDAKADDLRLKYHPGTGLLLVSGTEPAIKTVESVIGALRPKSPSAIAADEALRLNRVAEEVMRRRAARQTVASELAGTVTKPDVASTSATGDDSLSLEERNKIIEDEVSRRRALRSSAQKSPPSPPSAPLAPPPADQPTPQPEPAAKK
jgi:hypothetical protein